MRVFNRAHVPWFIFVCLATFAACVLYVGNFHPARMPAGIRLPDSLLQTPSDHRSVGGTPLGLIYGAISLGIFVFAALLGVRKRIVLWRIGTVQRWLRAHIWLTLLTIPLVILHSGFRFGGPMTTLLMVLYAIVMVSGIYGLILQHQLPHLMKERLPAETVYEQIPHIRAQLYAAAEKMRDSLKPAPPKKTDAGAPAPSAAKAVTAGSTPMASTAGELSTPTARAKTTAGSTITAQPVTTPPPPADKKESGKPAEPKSAAAAAATPSKLAPEEATSPQATEGSKTAAPGMVGTTPAKGSETMGTPTARVPEGVTPIPSGTEAAPPAVVPPPEASVMPPAASDASAAKPPATVANAPAGTAKPSQVISEPQTKVPAPAAAAPANPNPPAAPATATAATAKPAATAAKAAAPAKPATPAAAKPAAKPAAPAPVADPVSEAFLIDFIERQILPYLGASRGDKLQLGKARYSEDTFRFVKLRVAEAYRTRVEEIQAWCDERRMLDLQTRMQHWLHGWLFIHVPFSFLLLMLTAWHAFVTLFYY
jgi:hypothetical protein